MYVWGCGGGIYDIDYKTIKQNKRAYASYVYVCVCVVCAWKNSCTNFSVLWLFLIFFSISAF